MPTDLPIGPAIDWSPVQPPENRLLEGDYVRLAPLDPARHAADLFELSREAPELWTYMGYGPFADLAAFRKLAESDKVYASFDDDTDFQVKAMQSLEQLRRDIEALDALKEAIQTPHPQLTATAQIPVADA